MSLKVIPWGLIIKIVALVSIVGGIIYGYQQHRKEIYQEGYDAGYVSKTKEIQDLAEKQSAENSKRGNKSTGDANELSRLRQLNHKLAQDLKDRIRNEDLKSVPTDSGTLSKSFVIEWNSIALGATPTQSVTTTKTGTISK